MSEPILSVAAAARAVGLSVHVLRRMVHAGQVASVEVRGFRRVRLSAVRSAITEHAAA